MMGIEWLRPAAFLGSILYALIGVVIFWLCFWLIDKITPTDLWAEIVEKQNRALAMVVAAMCLGISIIVAAAIHSKHPLERLRRFPPLAHRCAIRAGGRRQRGGAAQPAQALARRLLAPVTPTARALP